MDDAIATADTAGSDGGDCRVRDAIASWFADESVLVGDTCMLVLSLILWRRRA
jgi:hypothetical protein